MMYPNNNNVWMGCLGKGQSSSIIEKGYMLHLTKDL